MFLLQSRFDTQFVSNANTTTIVIIVVVAVAFIALLLFAGVVASKRSRNGSGGSGKFRKGTFKRRATRLGLSKNQIRTLENIIERYKVKNPYSLLVNSPQLDFYLRKAVQEVEDQVADENVKEGQKLSLFRVKQIVERNSQKSQVIANTKQLKSNQAVAISGQEGQQYRSSIVAVLKDSIAAETPQDDSGNQIRWKKWSTVKVFFWKHNGEGFSFNSKVSGYNTFKGVASVFIQHSNKIEKARQRRFRRKELDRPCYFYPVRILTTGAGRNRVKKAFVESNRGAMGTILEVSAGGCSIQASKPLNKGALVKIDFETERTVRIASFGKVVNLEKDTSTSSVMHIMFTRVSRKNLNRINAYIYEYGNTS